MAGAADSPDLRLTLAEGAELAPSNGAVTVRGPSGEYVPSARSAVAQALFEGLADTPVAEGAAEERVLAEEGADELGRFCFDTAALLRSGLVHVVAETGRNGARRRLATLEPVSRDYRPGTATLDATTRVRLSRFAVVRRLERGPLVVESPLGHARVRLDAPAAVAALHPLAGGASAGAIAAELDLTEAGALAVLALLSQAGAADPVDEDGRTAEDRDDALRQWDHHDLYFHSRSRLGRHANPVGGQYRFLGELPPQPPVKETDWPVSVVLPAADLARTAATDPPLTTVIESRRSVRPPVDSPLDVAQLGEFLYRIARVRSAFSGGATGEFTSRPYPSGGASYELEIYLNTDSVAGVWPGFYWYDPMLHALRQVREPNADTHALMAEAHLATAGATRPQVLFVMAARFQRVSWKYDSMAYATILKDTGVLIGMMYLVATAMRLSPCALGIGDSDRFARLAGTRYVEESSVGEFILSGSINQA
jgi:SagB-type dehydrogenase family enzyme